MHQPCSLPLLSMWLPVAVAIKSVVLVVADTLQTTCSNGRCQAKEGFPGWLVVILRQQAGNRRPRVLLPGWLQR